MQNETSLLTQKNFIYVFSVFLIVSFGLAVYSENPIFLLLPTGVVFITLFIADYQAIYFLLFASIPVSIHIQSGPLALDVMTEPLMLCLLVISPFVFLKRHKEIN